MKQHLVKYTKPRDNTSTGHPLYRNSFRKSIRINKSDPKQFSQTFCFEKIPLKKRLSFGEEREERGSFFILMNGKKRIRKAQRARKTGGVSIHTTGKDSLFLSLPPLEFSLCDVYVDKNFLWHLMPAFRFYHFFPSSHSPSLPSSHSHFSSLLLLLEPPENIENDVTSLHPLHYSSSLVYYFSPSGFPLPFCF